jgi:hypothetical protein
MSSSSNTAHRSHRSTRRFVSTTSSSTYGSSSRQGAAMGSTSYLADTVPARLESQNRQQYNHSMENYRDTDNRHRPLLGHQPDPAPQPMYQPNAPTMIDERPQGRAGGFASERGTGTGQEVNDLSCCQPTRTVVNDPTYRPPTMHTRWCANRPPKPAPGTEPANPQSILLTPEDIAMASHQLNIDNLSPEDRVKQEEWARIMCRQSVGCMSGFEFYRIKGGYRCGGGFHYTTDKLLAEGKGGHLMKLGGKLRGPFYHHASGHWLPIVDGKWGAALEFVRRNDNAARVEKARNDEAARVEKERRR